MGQQTMKMKGVTLVSATTAAGRTLDRQFLINSEVASPVEPFWFPSGALVSSIPIWPCGVVVAVAYLLEDSTLARSCSSERGQ
jgi:hypothetical protein